MFHIHIFTVNNAKFIIHLMFCHTHCVFFKVNYFFFLRFWSSSHFIPFNDDSRRRVLIIGGSFSGLAAGRDLGSHYLVTIIDAKDHLGMDGMGWEMMNMNEFCEINKTTICDSDRCTMSRNQWKELLLT